MVKRECSISEWYWIKAIGLTAVGGVLSGRLRVGSGYAALTSNGGWDGAASECNHSVPSPDSLTVGTRLCSSVVALERS